MKPVTAENRINSPLDLMTCGKPNHIWSGRKEYNEGDCPICALETAGRVFRTYEMLHKEKTPPDEAKAARNAQYAEFCERIANAE